VRTLFSRYGNNPTKIYLLIDEYDHFTNEILIRDLTEFKKSVSQDGYVRKFYECIKIATQQGVVNRFFITGVSPMTLDSLTSGFNIVKHLSHSRYFHDMMGFTEAEVESLVDKTLDDMTLKSQIMSDLRSWYNGYKFNLDTKNTVYNANMVLYFLDEFSRTQQYPRLMLDPNLMPDYTKLKKMFEVANYKANLDVLQQVLETGVVAAEQIYQFDFSRPFGKIQFINFLYYLGNLTLKEEREMGIGAVFQIPNHVIKELYWEYYAYILQERIDFKYEDDQIKEAIYGLMQGNWQPFFTIVENTLQEVSNRDFIQLSEKNVKMVMIAYAMQGKSFYVRSERETKERKYIDLELYRRPNNHKEHHQYIFEIKYLPKKEEHLFEEVKSKAIAQLKVYLQDETVQAAALLNAFVVVVVNDKLYFEQVNG
jgi:hypothetical protein